MLIYNQNSAVNVLAGLLQVVSNFSILTRIQTDSETQAASCSVCKQSSFLICKAAWHDSDHSLLTSIGVKHEWMYTSTPPVWSTQWKVYFNIHYTSLLIYKMLIYIM
jgi:hypothetical protein